MCADIHTTPYGRRSPISTVNQRPYYSPPTPTRPLAGPSAATAPATSSNLAASMPALPSTSPPPPAPAPTLQEENAFLKHYIAQCEHQLRHYQQQLPHLPSPSPPPTALVAPQLPLWLSSPPQLAQLPALLVAYERRVAELTGQVSALLGEGREKDRRVRLAEEEVEDVLDRWRRHLEAEKAAGGGSGGGGGGGGGGRVRAGGGEEKDGGDEADEQQLSVEESLQVEMESYREQVDILKQQARLRAEEEGRARKRQEEIVGQLRQQLAVLTRNAAQVQERKQNDSQRGQQAEQFEQQAKEAQRQVELLTAELAVLKDDKARLEKQLQRMQDDKQQNTRERDERVSILDQLQQSLARSDDTNTKHLATISALQQQVATLDQQLTLKTQQLQLTVQQRDEQDASMREQAAALRHEAEADVKAREERWQGEAARWREERRAVEVRLVEERERAERAGREALKAEERHGRAQAEWMRRVEAANKQQAEEAVRVVEREEQRRSEKAKHEREMDELRVMRERNEKEITAAREKTRKLAEKDEKLEQDLTIAREKLAAVLKEDGKWEKEVAMTKRLHEQQVSRLEDKVEEIERRRKEERDERERQIEQLTQQLAATSKRCVELEAAKDKLEAELSAMGRRVSDAKDECERERRDRQRWQSTAAELTSGHDHASQAHGRTRAEHGRLLAALASLRAEHTGVLEERDAARRHEAALQHEVEVWRERATAERVKANLARRALDERAQGLAGRVEANTPVVSVPVLGGVGVGSSPMRGGGGGGMVWTPERKELSFGSSGSPFSGIGRYGDSPLPVGVALPPPQFRSPMRT